MKYISPGGHKGLPDRAEENGLCTAPSDNFDSAHLQAETTP